MLNKQSIRSIKIYEVLDIKKESRMDMNKISVILPVYKVEQYIDRCMETVLNQTYSNLEIILVDDGTPDNCGKICDQYAQKDSRVKVIHKENGGAPAARNDALKICTGEWIAYVDPDDWIELNEFEEVMKVINKDNPDIVIFNTYINIGDKQKLMQAFPEDFTSDNKDFIFQLQLSALNKNFNPYLHEWSQGYPWDKVFRASMLKENNVLWPTNVKANDDVIYDINAFQFAKKISYINKTFYHYRMNPESIGHRFMPDRIQIDKDIYNEMFRLRDIYKFGSEYEKAVYSRIVANMWLCARRYFFHPDNKRKHLDSIKELKQILKEEPFYTAFEKVDRSKLDGGAKYITLFRHNNAIWIYILNRLSELKK